MKKLVVIHYTIENYSPHALIRSLIRVFNDKEYRNILLEKYGLEVITSVDILNDLKKTESQFIDDINGNTHEFNDSIFFGIHPHGIYLVDKISEEVNARKNIKTVGWQDDPHCFSKFIQDRINKKIIIQKYSEKYDSPLIEKLDYLLSPSLVYFKNLNITKYDSKLIDMFYFIPPQYYERKFLEYKERKSKIILSGSASKGYVSRILFEKLKNKSKELDNLIHVQPHPGYDSKNNAHMTELNYYNRLSNFKGAFVGHYEFPLNYVLAKHIEVLMCGCLGFFEPNPLLESQLGLKEYVHYIPCYKDGALIEDANFYKEWIKNGEEIAKNGQNFVMENFGEKQIHKLFDFFKRIS